MDVRDGGICCFLAMNSALRLAFLLCVEGLGFFLFPLTFQGLAPGVQGEGEVGANREGEVEDLALADQCLAEGQTLGCQGVCSTSSGAHFWRLLLN